MKRFEDISQLVDRFLEGNTTLAEERRLDEFFISHAGELGQMPEHLQITAEMFRELRSMRPEEAPAAKRRAGGWQKWAAAAAAACIALCFAWLYTRNMRQTAQDEQAIAAAQSASGASDTLEIKAAETQPAAAFAEKKPRKKRQAIALDPKAGECAPSSSAEGQEAPVEAVTAEGNAMLCGFNPSANMLPMRTDPGLRTVMAECEMALLEDEFQKTKRHSNTIEI